MSETTFTVSDNEKSLVIKRTFNASKSKVWEAWTTVDLLKQWFSPTGWETEVKRFDFSEGGSWEYIMKCVDPEQNDWIGMTSAGKSTYSSIKPEDSFENTDYFTDDVGNVSKEAPVSNSLIEFADNGDDTTTVISTTSYDSKEALQEVIKMGMEEGLSQSWDKLASVLEHK